MGMRRRTAVARLLLKRRPTRPRNPLPSVAQWAGSLLRPGVSGLPDRKLAPLPARRRRRRGLGFEPQVATRPAGTVAPPPPCEGAPRGSPARPPGWAASEAAYSFYGRALRGFSVYGGLKVILTLLAYDRKDARRSVECFLGTMPASPVSDARGRRRENEPPVPTARAGVSRFGNHPWALWEPTLHPRTGPAATAPRTRRAQERSSLYAVIPERTVNQAGRRTAISARM